MSIVNISPLCIKRLKNDLKILRKHPLKYVSAQMDDKNVLIWYFLIIGPKLYDPGVGIDKECPYGDGHFIGKIMHSPNYPLKPPDFMMLTPNGRFTINKKICMSNTGYHSNEWSPSWTIKAILQGFLSIMLDDTEKGISHIKNDFKSRKKMAEDSKQYNLKNYPKIYEKFETFIERHSKKDDKDVKKKKEKIIVKEKRKKKDTTNSKNKDDIFNITKWSPNNEIYINKTSETSYLQLIKTTTFV